MFENAVYSIGRRPWAQSVRDRCASWVNSSHYAAMFSFSRFTDPSFCHDCHCIVWKQREQIWRYLESVEPPKAKKKNREQTRKESSKPTVQRGNQKQVFSFRMENGAAMAAIWQWRWCNVVWNMYWSSHHRLNCWFKECIFDRQQIQEGSKCQTSWGIG